MRESFHGKNKQQSLDDSSANDCTGCEHVVWQEEEEVEVDERGKRGEDEGCESRLPDSEGAMR